MITRLLIRWLGPILFLLPAVTNADTIIVRGPNAQTHAALLQFGTNAGAYNALRGERRSNIQALQRKLDGCDACIDREKIACELEYWKNLDATVEKTISNVLMTMGYGASGDVRNLLDPTRRAREAARADISRRLNLDIGIYCRNILKKDGDAFNACLEEYNEGYLYAMSESIQPLCYKYATEITGLNFNEEPRQPRNPLDREADRKYFEQLAAFRKYKGSVDGCNRQFNPLEIVRYNAFKYEDRQKWLAGYAGRAIELLAQRCAYQNKEKPDYNPADAYNAPEAFSCKLDDNIDDLAERSMQNEETCADKLKAQFGITPETRAMAYPDAYADGLKECEAIADPQRPLRDEVSALLVKHGILGEQEFRAARSSVRKLYSARKRI